MLHKTNVNQPIEVFSTKPAAVPDNMFIGALVYFTPDVAYPLCVRGIIRDENSIRWHIDDANASTAGSIEFDLTGAAGTILGNVSDIYGEFSGCFKGNQKLIDFLKTVPETEFDMSECVLSLNICARKSPSPVSPVLYDDRPVTKITPPAGSTIVQNADDSYSVVQTIGSADAAGVTSITITAGTDSVVLTGEHVTILPKDGDVKIVTEQGTLLIGNSKNISTRLGL